MAGWILAKTLDNTNATIQYGFHYDTVLNIINLVLNGTGKRDVSNVFKNTWYSLIIYHNSVGLITPYINKVPQATGSYGTALSSQPNIRLGAKTMNGTTHNNYLKSNIATQE
jgi:hypothetical protein